MKNCTPLWREAHFKVKMYKTYHSYFEAKMYKTHHAQTTFGSSNVEKVHAVVARSTFQSQKCKKLTGSEHSWTFRCRFGGRRKGLCTLSTASKTWRFCSIPKTMAGVGHLQRIAKMHFAWQAQYKMFIRDVRRLGRWFFERGSFWSIKSVGLMRWFCVTGAALRMTWHIFFVAGAIL